MMKSILLVLSALSLSRASQNAYLFISDGTSKIFSQKILVPEESVNETHIETVGSAEVLFDEVKGPTYLEFCPLLSSLFFCEEQARRISALEVSFEPSLNSSGKASLIVGDVNCSDLHVDKNGNLFFINRDDDSINKVLCSDITKVMNGSMPQLEFTQVYSKNDTTLLSGVSGLHIEEESVSWVNSKEGAGLIHTGFTLPFIKSIPYHSYLLDGVEQAFSIDGKDDLLCFTTPSTPKGRVLQTNTTNTTNDTADNATSPPSLPKQYQALISMNKQNDSYQQVTNELEDSRAILLVGDKVLVAEAS
jgi:hypothetical protein